MSTVTVVISSIAIVQGREPSTINSSLVSRMLPLPTFRGRSSEMLYKVSGSLETGVEKELDNSFL